MLFKKQVFVSIASLFLFFSDITTAHSTGPMGKTTPGLAH